ncbi:unnamed protein product [Caenorhabditis auriculariae]|uniref:G-protein coupled receptors family 1 profile domain-containing protein n=1 Tax=Caenorhabditis auriculariae TaxID=2777116 RepID=A0A8S1HTU2_9PELO|nr:unnamed protein product [Caenorhabditis auriculariae]
MQNSRVHLIRRSFDRMNGSETVDGGQLRHETSDFIQIVLYSLCVLVGLPVNVSTFVYMVRRYRHAKSFLLLLHINLNISDILVLGVHVPGLIGWLVTLQWEAGPIFCKVMRLLDGFVFAISSNIMVCIALYRLYALRYPLWVAAVGHSRVPRMLLVAWLVAGLSVVSQLYVWREVEFSEPQKVTQCVTLWTEKLWTTGQLSESEKLWMNFYSIENTVILFYVPLSVLVVCYVLILKDIYKTLNTDTDTSSAMYLSEVSKQSSGGKAGKSTKKELESCVTLTTRTIRGQDKFRRAKVRSLRITLMLILTYVVTWLPYNLLAWWMVLNFESYKANLDANYIFTSLVVLNSVINPFIYGRRSRSSSRAISSRPPHGQKSFVGCCKDDLDSVT